MRQRVKITQNVAKKVGKYAPKVRSDSSFCFGCYTFAKSNVLQCSRCKTAKYCTVSCQQSDWKRHKAFCGNNESDVSSMYRAAFEAPMEYAKSKLEALTQGGSIEAAICIRSGTISEDKPFIITMKTQRIILDFYYKGKFTRGAYIVEFMRGLMRCAGWAMRTEKGWTFGINPESESGRHLRDNITMATALHANDESLEAYLDGRLDVDRHVATIMAVAEKKNPDARKKDGPEIVELAAEALPQIFLDGARETGHIPNTTEEQSEKMREVAKQMTAAKENPEEMQKILAKLTDEAGVNPEIIAKITADLAGEDVTEMLKETKV